MWARNAEPLAGCQAALGAEGVTQLSRFAVGHKGWQWRSCPKIGGNRKTHEALQARLQETLLQAGSLSLAPTLHWYTVARAA